MAFQEVESWLESAGDKQWLAQVYGPNGEQLHEFDDIGTGEPYSVAERAVADYFTSDLQSSVGMLAETIRVMVFHVSGASFGPIEVETSLETVASREI